MSEIKISDQERFGNLTFSDFKKMAVDSSLTCFEKIGFPNAYRQGKEDVIFKDILTKLTNLQEQNKLVLDIGAGCSRLPLIFAELCRTNQHQLFLVDSQEMLNQLPDESYISKIPGFYPSTCKDFIAEYKQRFDVILSYSVLQYVFAEANLFEFIDESLSLLADGGQLLLGDIPNSSKRKRFLSSQAGIRYHQKYFDPNSEPQVNHMQLEPKQIDDGVLTGVLLRCRSAGYDAYIIPQAIDLPMANRREDILIIKP